jgi:hypothetical protein
MDRQAWRPAQAVHGSLLKWWLGQMVFVAIMLMPLWPVIPLLFINY